MNKTLFHRVFKPALISMLAGLFVIPTAVLATASQASGAPKVAAPVMNKANAGGLIIATAENSIAPAPAPVQGDLVSTYKWIINIDPTGDANQPFGDTICHPKTPTNPTGNPNFPDAPTPGTLGNSAPNTAYAPCQWPSVHQLQSSQLVSSGTEADWNATTPIPLQVGGAGRGLKAGKYLVSVLAAGYQLGGSHFQVVADNNNVLHIQGSPALVNPAGSPKSPADGFVGVNLNPWPIPLATMRLKVYQDMASANSQWDEQTEPGIAGFKAQIADFDGQVTSDYYGNPMCTAYRTTDGIDANGQPVGSTELGIDGRPIVDPLHHWLGLKEVDGPSTGKCLSDSTGEIAIPNLAPNRYGVQVIAPERSTMPDPAATSTDPGTYKLCPTADTKPNTTVPVLSEPCWVQTDTIEGGHEIDVWLTANDTGLDSEQVVGGEKVPWVRYGYVLAGCMAPANLNKQDGNTVGAGINPRYYNAPSECLVDKNTDPTKRDPSLGGVFPNTGGNTSNITGRLMGSNAYIPGIGALPGLTNGTNGTGGIKPEPKPSPDSCKTVPVANCQYLKHGWVALSDLSNNDKTVYVMPANQDGTFKITGVPDGSYSLAIWDQSQDYIFDSFNVTVSGGTPDGSHTIALGQLPLLQWFARVYGHVFIDTNGNGRQDPGEPGVADLDMQNLNRTNNAYEQGQNIAKTDDHGYYEFTEAYPLGANNVEQFFFTRYKTTGLTFQACNDPQEHTYLTPAVDVSILPIISQCVRVDVGVKPYALGDNGGIVATVFDQTVRAHYLGRQQVPYGSNVGVPGMLTELFQAVKDPITGKFEKHCANPDYLTSGTCTLDGSNDGSYVTTGPDKGYNAPNGADQALGNPSAYTTEHYGKAAPVNTYTAASPNPAACIARDANGNVTQGQLTASGLVTVDGNPANTTPTMQDALPGLKADGTQACIEAPQTGQVVQFGTDNQPLNPMDPACTPIADPNYPNIPATYAPTSATHGVQTVDGNWALTPVNPDGSPATGDYLTKVDIPGDTVLPQVDGADRPLWKVATEQDVNNFGPAQGLAACTAVVGTPGACQENNGKGTTPEFVPQGPIDWTHTYDAQGTGAGNTFAWPPRSAPAKQMTPAVATPTAESPNTYLENPSTYTSGPDVQCAGAQFTVTVASDGTNIPGRSVNNPDSKSVGTSNAFLANGGSPIEGAPRNLCDIHLIHVQNGQSAAPNFNLYTDVPIPAMYQVQIFDDVSTSVDRRSTQYGEVASVPNAPIGVYDYAGNLQTTVTSDPNGITEVLMPSSDMTNCQNAPAAECSQVYRFVGNDPGTPDAPNANWNPAYSTIAAQFQAMPGIFEPADVAPFRASAVTHPDAQFNVFTACQPTLLIPQFFSVNRPYTFVNHTSDQTDTLVLNGVNFGTSKGTVRLDASGVGGNIVNISGNNLVWTDTKITVTLHTDSIDPNPYQVSIRIPGTPITEVKALTYHVIDSGHYSPKVYEVGNGPGAPAWAAAQHQTPTVYNFTQDALEAAAGYQVQITGSGPNNSSYADLPHGNPVSQALVVVYPTTPTPFAPLSARYEHFVIHSNVKVQGVGPGGFQPGTPGGPSIAVPGTIFDGRFFNSLFDHVVDGDPFVSLPPNADVSMTAEHALQLWYAVMSGAPLASDTWTTDNGHVNGINPVGFLTGGQVATVLGRQAHPYGTAFPPSIDGLGITGGTAVNGPSNVNTFTGNKSGPAPAPNEEQGGAIYLNGHADFTQITNDAVYSNSGAYGAIRIGTPQMHGQHNHHVVIANNRIVANSGINLAGAIGLFNDSSGYSIHHNLICGNASAEYGGGISQNGFSGVATAATNGDGYTAAEVATDLGATTSTIADNKVFLNNSYDEGGGIAIAGELNAASNAASIGTGPVDILRNYISANLGNDDGGGIRFLMAGNYPMRVVNDMITDNVSTHEGGGISIDDTPKVFIVNSTIAKNITTATAATSNGSPAPAGVSTSQNSAALQATLPAGSPLFSNPLIFNDIFWDNRAGSWTPTGVTGIGLTGDTTPINLWNLGTADGNFQMSPTNSILDSTQGTVLSGTNKVGPLANPAFVAPYDMGVSITAIRTSVRFRPSAIVGVSVPANVAGDYTVPTTSPAVGMGAVSKSVPNYQRPPNGFNAPNNDITGTPRSSPLTVGAWQKAAVVPPVIIPAAGTQQAAATVVAPNGPNCTLRLLLIALAQLTGRTPPPGGLGVCAPATNSVRVP